MRFKYFIYGIFTCVLLSVLYKSGMSDWRWWVFLVLNALGVAILLADYEAEIKKRLDSQGHT